MWKRQRRKKQRAAPFPPAWKTILETRCPFYLRLPPADQRELQGHLQVFVAEKNFEGCGGLAVSDEMRVSVAAQACLLLLHRQTDYYPGLRSILLYPSTYFVKETRHVGAGVLGESDEAHEGEAWHSGAIVLAWDAVCESLEDPADGYNVVLHEFAHQLDFEDGLANGAPALAEGHAWSLRKRRYSAWSRILSAEFERLCAQADEGKTTFLDEYGATDPAEFFAVATETFFELPREMKEQHPELYHVLKEYYCQDPAEWPDAPG